MIAWPETLSLPTVEGYDIQPGDAILRTEIEAGPARQRRRFTQVPSRVSVRWIMRRDQFALFEVWYRWQAKEGGAWFEIELLSELGLLTQEARFTRQFQTQLLDGTLWEIRSELEIRERPVLDEGLLNLLLSEDAQGIITVSNSLYVLVHQTLPASINQQTKGNSYDLADRSAGCGDACPNGQPAPAQHYSWR